MHQVGFIYKHISRFSITRTKLYIIWNTCTLEGGHVTVLRFIGACEYQNSFSPTVAPRYGSGGQSLAQHREGSALS